jgi:hypothetical protein
MTLSEKQSEKFLKVWNAYLADGEKYVYPTSGFTHQELDQHRVKLIPELKNLIDRFVYGSITIEEFKTKLEEINKVNLLWGFNGPNGQAFLNLIAKTSLEARLQHELINLFKETLPLPVTVDFAVNNIRTFRKFTLNLLTAAQDLQGTLKLDSIPYFLSYFWQIQKPDKWPIYYTALVTELGDLEIWAPSDDQARNYSEFYELNQHMLALAEDQTGKQVTLWEIEHAFWNSAILRNSPPAATPVPALTPQMPESKPVPVSSKPDRDSEPPTTRIERKGVHRETRAVLPDLSDGFIPPVVACLPTLAANDAHITAQCAQSGKSIEKELDERLAILFRMLGYETKSLGQGHSRIPDAVAICKEHQYAVIYDARISQHGYSVAADEPALREYILKFGDRLRKQGYRAIYFMIISSAFNGEYDDATRALKIETGVNEVILVEADALLALLESKLRDPEISLGPKSIQKLLAASGLLTKGGVRDFFEA